jgi:hypothetical protein
VPRLTLHFEASPGTDPDSLSAEIAEALKSVPDVETAEAETLRTQGAVEIIAAVAFATKVIVTSAQFLSAVTELVKAWQALRARFPSLPAPTVEIGLRQVPIDQVTTTDAEKAVRA